MQTPANTMLQSTNSPLIDKNVNRLVAQRAQLKRKQTKTFAIACVMFVAAIILLLVLASIPGQSPYIVAIFMVFAIISAIFAGYGMYCHLQFSQLLAPLTLALNVRSGLINAGFYYDNHKTFFGNYWVFHETESGRIAFVDTRLPFDPIVADSGSHVALKVDGKFVFVGKVGEHQPQLSMFNVFPDYHYRIKSNPVYFEAEFFNTDNVKRVLNLEFRFGNASRRQFMSLINFIC